MTMRSFFGFGDKKRQEDSSSGILIGYGKTIEIVWNLGNGLCGGNFRLCGKFMAMALLNNNSASLFANKFLALLE